MGGNVSEAHRGESDHTEVERVKQGQVVARSFQVLNAADADGGRQGGKEEESKKTMRTLHNNSPAEGLVVFFKG